MQKWGSKSESTRKTEQNRSSWNFLTMVKVNGQRSTDDVYWHGSVMSPRAYVAGREAQQARVVRGRAWDWRVRWVRRMADTGGAWSACSWGRNFSRRVWCSFWQFLVGFCSGLAILSSYAFSLAVEWAERWYSTVTGTVGVTAVACFWQWLLDEGEGSGRTLAMSTGTRKSKEWLWYHVNNISERERLNSLYIDV